ncbi:hypothetical protein L218DRAFT_874330 [Marasmius fiardii PR-910]|nr:hypothetical protein L218DRAFT_874330 [Marasmius fiardii PR-910]
MTSYGNGGGASSVIPAGQLFAGRSIGGGTRDQIYGTKTYGSGYPGIPGRGVAGRGFPFYFWPVVWGDGAGAAIGGASSYLYTSEYGLPSNTSRPGGPLHVAAFRSNFEPQTLLHILSDNTTIAGLITNIRRNCSTYIAPWNSTFVLPFDTSSPAPKPEQAIQYYRASSVVLTLSGYNNTAVFASINTRDLDLPCSYDSRMIDCVNHTIGVGVPLTNQISGGSDVVPEPYATVVLVAVGVIVIVHVMGSFSQIFRSLFANRR